MRTSRETATVRIVARQKGSGDMWVAVVVPAYEIRVDNPRFPWRHPEVTFKPVA